jgi:nicotinamidase/pyrazinamidase
VKTVFFDVDTQLDFLYPAGALYVPGAEEIVNQLGQLTRFAAKHGVLIISTADAHTEDDPEFKSWKPHCVVGTTGQAKAGATSLPSALVLSTAPEALDALRLQVESAQQIVVEKQMIDCFTNPHLRALLDLLHADRYVVYGVVTEFCVRCAAFGLLQSAKGADAGRHTKGNLRAPSGGALDTAPVLREFLQTGARVELVQDAIKSLSEPAEHETISRFQAAGGVLTTVAAITG